MHPWEDGSQFDLEQRSINALRLERGLRPLDGDTAVEIADLKRIRDRIAQLKLTMQDVDEIRAEIHRWREYEELDPISRQTIAGWMDSLASVAEAALMPPLRSK